MKKYSLSEIAKYINGNLYGKILVSSKFSIDSRNINNGDVFICLKVKITTDMILLKIVLKNASCIITSKDIR
jgi:UDP-N-acetylmuramyl pentapeptide synthase